MPPEDVLLMMAQLGVAIAGFNGVATALRQGERRSLRRRIGGSILITAAGSVTFWSVVPLVLLTTEIDSSSIWRGSSFGWAAFQVGINVFRNWQARKLGLATSPMVHVFRFLSVLTVILQIWNGFAGGVAWPHVVAVSLSLVVSIVAFFVLFHEDEDDA